MLASRFRQPSARVPSVVLREASRPGGRHYRLHDIRVHLRVDIPCCQEDVVHFELQREQPKPDEFFTRAEDGENVDFDRHFVFRVLSTNGRPLRNTYHLESKYANILHVVYCSSLGPYRCPNEFDFKLSPLFLVKQRNEKRDL